MHSSLTYRNSWHARSPCTDHLRIITPRNTHRDNAKKKKKEKKETKEKKEKKEKKKKEKKKKTKKNRKQHERKTCGNWIQENLM
jgi:hypothetical protein